MGAAYLRGPDDPTRRVPCAKIGFESRVIAMRALPQIRKPAAGGLRIYRCTICHLWHHGHRTPSKVRHAMVRKTRKF